MKRKLLFSSLLLSATLTLQANPITRAEARQVAEELVGINDSSSDDVPVAPYYIFSRGAGQGYVFVSGDDSTAPILGYTETGDFDEGQLPEQLKGMLENWSRIIFEIQQHPTATIRKPMRARAIASYKKDWKEVDALIKTHWHQDAPYNILAPIKEGVGRCMTGCVATAGSQVTFYFRKDNPSELQYATPTYEYGTPITESLPKGTPIEWNLMKLSGRGTEKQDSAVAKLMYALGTSAWLTYGDGEGLATSGYNSNMGDAMKGQFRLNYEHKYKGEETQQQWETLIYNNLKTGRPMLYSGYKDEQTGGHSVVLDGYQASTGLYHFNFGWGGQGDGYFTVDDETGMNGFNQYQDLVYNITPQKQNLKGEVTADVIYHKTPTEIEAVVTNNGTLDYSGFRIYTSTTKSMPTSITAKNDTTVVEAGKSVTMKFTVTPTSEGTYYVFLCDKNRNVIDTLKMDVTPTVADLHLEKIGVDAGSETIVNDDITYEIVNNSNVNVTVSLLNGPEGTYCQPNIRCWVDAYNQDTKEWSNKYTLPINTYVFESGQRHDVVYTFRNLTEGTFYRAYLDSKVLGTTATSYIQNDTEKNVVYFTVRQPDLTVTNEGRTAVVTGHWNTALFNSLATDASVCSYDITALTDLTEQPVVPNPNAIFYASPENTSWSDYENVVVGDVCKQLTVRTAADFHPLKPFTAEKVSFVLSGAEPGTWYGALIPFTLPVPYGMQMNRAVSVNDKGNMITHEPVRTVEAFSVVTYIMDRDGLNILEGENIAITMDESISLLDGKLRASTLSTPLEEGSLVFGEYINVPCFQKPEADQTTVEAFSPVYKSTSNTVRATDNSTVERLYKVMAVTIHNAYSALDQYASAPSAACESLLSVLKTTEDMFTYRSHMENADVLNANNTLEDAIKALQEAWASGIAPIETTDSTAPVTYYNLSGQRIDRPSHGVVIIRQGNTVRKVMIK